MEALLKKNQEAQSMIDLLKSQIEFLKKSGCEVSKLEEQGLSIMKENRELAVKIASKKNELLKMELLNGEIQVDVPLVAKSEKVDLVKEKPQIQNNATENKVLQAKEQPQKESKPKEQPHKECKPKEQPQKESKPKEQKETKPKSNEASEAIDISRFDMRIGKILEVSKHPDAESLYVEQVDIGEGKPRQIISGLVKYCSECDLLGRMAVFLVNLKPAKMRGVMSEGMIMCASAPEQGIVEPLIVPEGVKPGDRVTVEGYGGTPDEPIMNPKKKILETVKPEMIVNGDGVATYRNARWQVNGHVIVSNKLKNVQIA